MVAQLPPQVELAEHHSISILLEDQSPVVYLAAIWSGVGSIIGAGAARIGAFIGCTESEKKRDGETGAARWFFARWKRLLAGPANYFPIAFPCASCEPSLLTRRGKTDACDLPLWRLNKLRATNFNRNSDYAEESREHARTIISRVCGDITRSVCSHNRFFDPLEKNFSHTWTTWDSLLFRLQIIPSKCYFFPIDKHYPTNLCYFLRNFYFFASCMVSRWRSPWRKLRVSAT